MLSDFVLMTTDARIDEVQLHSVGGHVVTKVYKYARQVSVGGEIWRGGDDFTTSVQYVASVGIKTSKSSTAAASNLNNDVCDTRILQVN